MTSYMFGGFVDEKRNPYKEGNNDGNQIKVKP